METERGKLNECEDEAIEKIAQAFVAIAIEQCKQNSIRINNQLPDA